jgi:hypothetical protein
VKRCPLKESTFDLFSGVGKQDAVWLESVAGLENAKRRMERRAIEKPGAYFVFDLSADAIVAKTDSGGPPKPRSWEGEGGTA